MRLIRVLAFCASSDLSRRSARFEFGHDVEHGIVADRALRIAGTETEETFLDVCQFHGVRVVSIRHCGDLAVGLCVGFDVREQQIFYQRIQFPGDALSPAAATLILPRALIPASRP